ncbi:MAG: hypothetical protein ACKOVA_02865, partial [Novosphingobium sp.]
MPQPEPSTDGLIVLLPAEPGHGWSWWRVTGGVVGREHIFDGAGNSAPWGDVGAVTALVPAGPAPVRDKPLPLDMPLVQALAAERLGLAQGGALAQGERHVVVAAAEGRLLSASVDQHEMDRWIAALSEQGLDPPAIVPAALVLPREEVALVLG